MKRNLVIILITCISISVFSCKKESDLDVSDLNLKGDSWNPTEVDIWLNKNFREPYNIEVLYRWNPGEVSLNSTLVPPEEKYVIPVMDMIKSSWIDVYTKIAGNDFIKEHAPRQYLLVGSAEYNSNGGLTFGLAEAGAKIVLFRANWFDLKNRPLIKRMLKTIQHEFAHILNQKIKYQPNYELITPGDYTSTWTQLKEDDARKLGFITPYASSNPNEDFAEMVAVLLTEGRGGYEAILRTITDPTGLSKIRQKEALVIEYFQRAWNIDFYELEKEAEIALVNISPIPLPDLIGVDYTSFIFDIDNPDNKGPEFTTAVKNSRNTFAANNRKLDEYTFIFDSPNPKSVILRANYTNNLGTGDKNIANVKFDVSFDATKTKITFSNPVAVGGNATSRWLSLKPVLDYLSSREFYVEFKPGHNSVSEGVKLGGFVNVNNSGDFFYSILN